MPEAQEAKCAGVVSFHLFRADSVVIFSHACESRFVFFFLGFNHTPQTQEAKVAGAVSLDGNVRNQITGKFRIFEVISWSNSLSVLVAGTQTSWKFRQVY